MKVQAGSNNCLCNEVAGVLPTCRVQHLERAKQVWAVLVVNSDISFDTLGWGIDGILIFPP